MALCRHLTVLLTCLVTVQVQAGYLGRKPVGNPDTLLLSDGEGAKSVTTLPPLDVCSTDVEAAPRLEGEQTTVPTFNRTQDSSEGRGACGDLEEYHGHTSKIPTAGQGEMGFSRSSANGGLQQYNVSVFDAEMQEMLTFLEKGEELLKLGSQRDVVLILWNRAPNRKAFIQHIDDHYKTESLKVGETYSGELVFEDGDDSSGTNISNSFIELFVNGDTNTAFCLYNISNKSRRVSHEIASLYFLKRILNSARNVKIVLSIGYPSEVEDLNKEDFLTLVTQSTILISNVTKFRQSMVLIVSEEYKKGARQLQDHEVLNEVAKFLEATKRLISEKDQLEDTWSGEELNRASAIELIDALVANNSNGYVRIGLLRDPDADMKNSSGSEGDEMDLKTTIDDHTTFVEQENYDFQFKLSEELKTKVEMLENYTNEIIRSKLSLVEGDILQFYRSREEQTRDIGTLLHQLQEACHVLSDMTRNISQSPEPKTVARTLVNALKTLEVNVGIDNLIDIARQCKYLQILQIVSGHESAATQTTQWMGPIRNIVNEIRDSKDWFTFLVDMREKLLETGPPTIILDSRRGIRSVGVGNSSPRESLTDIESYSIEGYENITRSDIGIVRLKALRSVLRATEREKMTITCLDGQTVLAKGAYVTLSDVLHYKCKSNVKSIEIFASEEVLMDADIVKVGEEMQVRILAPRWRVTAPRKIILNGAPGSRQRPQRAADGHRPGYGGRDGKPGLPGGNAGSYFGISKEFIKNKIVIYSPIGGMGGPGQDGGNGAEGRRGDDPHVPSSRTHCDLTKSSGWNWHRTDFKSWKWRWSCFCFYDFYKYELYGSRGGVGGRGGHGGEGGLGGRGGRSKHIQLHNAALSWDRVGRNGNNGEKGKGGTGGEGGQNGNTVTVQCKSDWYVAFSIYRWAECGRRAGGRSNRGQDGIRGANNQLMRKPQEDNAFKGELSSVINRYKDYLISSLDDTVNKTPLMQFIMLLGSDLHVQSTYDTLALVNELQTLESRFYKRSTEVDFLSLYQSLLQRVTRYAANRKPGENSGQYKKVLSFVYTATLSKMRALKQSSDRSLVTNMDGYLDLTLEYVRELKEISKLDAIGKITNDYRDKINEKIISANDFINRDVLPEIEIIGNETDVTINGLILELIEMRKSAREDEVTLRKKEKELEDSLPYKITSGIVNFVRGALSLASPLAHAAVRLIGQVNSVSQVLALRSRGSDWTSIRLPQVALPNLQQQFDAVLGVTNRTVAAFRHQLNTVLLAVRGNPMYLGDMERKVKDLEGRLNKVGQLDVREIRNLQDELMKEIKRKEEEFKKLHNRHTRDIRVTKRAFASDVLSALGKIGTIAKIFSDLFAKHRDNMNALNEMDRAIKGAQDKFNKLNKYEEKIQNILLPMIRAMERDMAHAQNNLGSQSKVSLRVTAWRVQKTLKDVKLQLRQFTEGFKVQENLSRCIEELDDTMTTLIDVYDRIQSYTEQKEFADYVADIASADSDNIQIADRKLKDAVRTLEKTIRTNILFGQYEKLVVAFKQWVFPFAELWLQNFNLPSYLVTNDSYEGFVPVVTSQLRTLKSKLTEYKTSIIKGIHSYIHKAEFSSDYKSSQPFYVWDNKRYKFTILNLLAGKEVVLLADILNGVKKNAVKFNTIEINFKSVYKSIQEELEKRLARFHVKLTHHGNSHYKCGSKFYIIRGDNQTVEYSREKRGDGQPMDHNSVYTKLCKGDLMLSPYAMWSIRLVNVTEVNFAELKALGNFVDLELAGQGQYVSEGADVCNQDLGRHYELDGSFSEFDRVV